MLSSSTSPTVDKFMVMGTTQSDWARVASLAVSNDRVHPAFGIHPWFSTTVSDEWLDELRSYLLQFPNALVGEIGLDRIAKDKDTGLVFPIDIQVSVFMKQLDIAMELKRHVSIHALKCYGVLIDIFKNRFDFNLSSNVVLHSYGGSIVRLLCLIQVGIDNCTMPTDKEMLQVYFLWHF